MQTIGPLKIINDNFQDDILVPLATFETPLFPSTNRGARVSMVCGGIKTTLISEHMTRSIVVSASSCAYLATVANSLTNDMETLKKLASEYSRFAKLVDVDTHIVGNLLYIRLAFSTGDASGHNMATQGADTIMTWLLEQFSELEYGSISGNFCTDKKVSSVNSLLGRGKYVVAEITIDRKTCARYLKTTPEKMVQMNTQKNLVGSIAAGSLHSANSHYANMLLALYLATGQDAANIVEGSQGITHTEVRDDGLYFSVTLPNIIVGTVGNGKDLDFVKQNLEQLGCTPDGEPGQSARRLAMITAATVLCGELSCLAAQTNPGELIGSHLRIERKKGETCG